MTRWLPRTFTLLITTPTYSIHTLSLHDALPIFRLKLNPLREVIRGQRLVVVDDSIVRGNTQRALIRMLREAGAAEIHVRIRSEEHTSELQSRGHLVCRLLLEKKKLCYQDLIDNR